MKHCRYMFYILRKAKNRMQNYARMSALITQKPFPSPIQQNTATCEYTITISTYSTCPVSTGSVLLHLVSMAIGSWGLITPSVFVCYCSYSIYCLPYWNTCVLNKATESVKSHYAQNRWLKLLSTEVTFNETERRFIVTLNKHKSYTSKQLCETSV